MTQPYGREEEDTRVAGRKEGRKGWREGGREQKKEELLLLGTQLSRNVLTPVRPQTVGASVAV